MATRTAPVFLARAKASPRWSPWWCVTRITSASRISSGQVGQAGLPVRKGSMKIVLEPLILTAEWPSQVISLFCSFADSFGLLFKSLYRSTEAFELILDLLVAAIEVFHVVDDGLAPGDQTGQDEGGRGPQVGGHDLGAGERRFSLDDGLVAVDLDVGAQAEEFVDVGETAVEDGLGDDGRPRGLGHEHHELGLHIGREPGIGRGGDILRLDVGAAADPERTVVYLL